MILKNLLIQIIKRKEEKIRQKIWEQKKYEEYFNKQKEKENEENKKKSEEKNLNNIKKQEELKIKLYKSLENLREKIETKEKNTENVLFKLNEKKERRN